MNLLQASAKYDQSIKSLIEQMRSLPVVDEAMRKDAGEASSATLSTPIVGPALAKNLPSDNIAEELARFKTTYDHAAAVRRTAGDLVANYRIGFGLLALAEAEGTKSVSAAHAALLADVTSAQNMELGLLRRTILLAFAEPPMQRLVTWPEGHLTIVLTLLMGMLGSTLYTTRFMLDYAIKGYRLTEPAPYPTSWFVFRPLFGAATALAIYVLFRAGQLVLTTEPASGGDSAGLNPFVIAFMAIIAGLMSWQALEFIETRGERWLRGQARENLWASGLSRLLQAKSKGAGELALEIGRTPRQVERWLRYRDRVTPEMQDRIAAVLEANPEQLFGKESPSGRAETAWGLARDLAAALDAAGLTREQLARHLSLDVAIVAGWSGRRRSLSPLQQERVADLLDQPLAELFEPVPIPVELTQVMQRQSVSVQQLAAALATGAAPVSEAEVQAWHDGMAQVPESRRDDVAAALGVAAYEIAWG
jgi:transcriptional regulator with XRE-family HTH domain